MCLLLIRSLGFVFCGVFAAVCSWLLVCRCCIFCVECLLLLIRCYLFVAVNVSLLLGSGYLFVVDCLLLCLLDFICMTLIGWLVIVVVCYILFFSVFVVVGFVVVCMLLFASCRLFGVV